MVSLGGTGRAAAVYLLLAGLQRGVSLLILPFITHAMVPAEYGAASVLTASALLFSATVAAPFESLIFREAARGEFNADAKIRIVGLYFYLCLPVFSLVLALMVVLCDFSIFGIEAIVWAIELTAMGFQPAVTYYAMPFVRARRLLRRFVWLALSSIVLTTATKMVLIVGFEMGVLGWAISDLMSAVISALLAIVLVRLPAAEVSKAHIREVLRFSVPLIPHRVSFWAVLSLSRPAMAVVAPMAQVGLLSFGLGLAAVAMMIMTEIQQAVLPRYSREKFPAPTNETREPVCLQLILAFVVPAIVGASVALTGVWLFAEDYWPSFTLTGVLLLGQVAWGLYLIPMNYIVQSAGLPKFSAISSVSGALVIMGGIFLLGREFGAMGVAYATVFGFGVMALVALALTKILQLEIRWTVWASVWPEILMGVIALCCSVAALHSPPASSRSYVFAGIALSMVVSSFVAYSRHRPRLGLD